ncbi:MAG: hypothetical protein ACJATN_001099 [Neolewinella sp.]|jgi:hypothetical protein
MLAGFTNYQRFYWLVDLMAFIGNEGTFSWDNSKPGCFLSATAGTMERQLKDITSLLYHYPTYSKLLLASTKRSFKHVIFGTFKSSMYATYFVPDLW